MPRRSGRCGVRLASVLVVAAGIVVLLALTPLAIQSSRESVRRNQCGDNLRQIAVALASYHDAHGMFPMGAMHAGLNPGGEPPVEAVLGPSWWFGILPLMDQHGGPQVHGFVNLDGIHGRKGEKTTWLTDAEGLMYDRLVEFQHPSEDVPYGFCADDVSRYLELYPYTVREGEHEARLSVRSVWPDYMRCPSSRVPVCETSVGPILLPTYVAIAGGCDIDPNSADYQISDRVPSDPVVPKTDRVYHNRFKGTGAAAGGIVTPSGMLPPCQHTELRGCTDGASNTMIVAEQSEWLGDRDPASTRLYHGDPGWTVGGTGPGGGWLSGTRRVDPVPQVEVPGGTPATWGADCWNITTVRYPPNYKRVLGNAPLPGCSENHGINDPLQSPHPGGLLAAMADGSVQFISEKTDLAVLLRLAIRDDGQQAGGTE